MDQVTRFRCTACGNLTRFDVTRTRRTRAFHHYSIGGELDVDDVEVLSDEIEEVVCRWCGSGASVVEITQDEITDDEITDDEALAAGETSDGA